MGHLVQKVGIRAGMPSVYFVKSIGLVRPIFFLFLLRCAIGSIRQLFGRSVESAAISSRNVRVTLPFIFFGIVRVSDRFAHHLEHTVSTRHRILLGLCVVQCVIPIASPAYKHIKLSCGSIFVATVHIKMGLSFWAASEISQENVLGPQQ
jgi:hypothetical protein